MKKCARTRGFTLVELVVVIAILGILAGIAIPRFMEAKKESERVTCLTHRKMIERSFHLAQSNGEHVDLSTFLEAVKTDEIVANKYFKSEPTCPSGGTYSVSSDDHVVCSVEYHNDTEDSEETEDVVDDIKTVAKGSWVDVLLVAATNEGTSLTIDKDGNPIDSVLYEQDGEYYLVFNGQYLSKELGVSEKELSKYAENNNSVVKVDFDAPMLTSDNFTTISGNVVWKADSIPSAGDIYQDGDDYYVRKYDSNSIWTALDVTDTTQWAKL